MLAVALALALIAPPEPPVVTLVKFKVADPDKPFVLLVALTVEADQVEAFQAAYQKAFDGTKAEAGYLAYELSRSADEPEKFLLYEKWKSADALAKHIDEPHTKEFLKVIGTASESTTLTVHQLVGR